VRIRTLSSQTHLRKVFGSLLLKAAYKYSCARLVDGMNTFKTTTTFSRTQLDAR
jgi:hypothetical protein